MLIDLERRPIDDHTRGHSRLHEAYWLRSAPFLLNPRGCLVHRIRSMVTIFWDGKPDHHVAKYWCGNQGSGEVLHEPPKDRLLCAVCEAAAVVHGQASAEQLVGRHVCTGRKRAVRVCCKSEEN